MKVEDIEPKDLWFFHFARWTPTLYFQLNVFFIFFGFVSYYLAIYGIRRPYFRIRQAVTSHPPECEVLVHHMAADLNKNAHGDARTLSPQEALCVICSLARKIQRLAP